MTGMALRRFGWALRARGPCVAEWPEHERQAAILLLRHSPAAREQLAETLAAEDAPAPDAAALDRVMCPVRRALAPLSPIMHGMRLGALAACVAAGLYIGALSADSDVVFDLLPAMHPSMPATVLAALEP